MSDTRASYDLLVVGAGLFGSCIARLATDSGKRVLVIERRPHIGGNCYTEKQNGIHIHRYGPHIFHTSNEAVWGFINRFCSLNSFINSPLAISRGELFSLPFNMYTFHQLWGVLTPDEALTKLEEQRLQLNRPPTNLEEQALTLVGRDLYERLIKGYTKKQWRQDPVDLPPEIIRRLPLRLTYNCNYFNDTYQGIPKGGYTQMFERMLEGIDVRLNIDFHDDRDFWECQAERVVYTGKIDELFHYSEGELEYRTQEFHDDWLETPNALGNAVVNYCDEEIAFTRKIEHQHFDPPLEPLNRTIVTREIPCAWDRSRIPYYPINNPRNMNIYNRYAAMTDTLPNYLIGGRLAEYRYYDMHAVIGSALLKAQAWGLMPT